MKRNNDTGIELVGTLVTEEAFYIDFLTIYNSVVEKVGSNVRSVNMEFIRNIDEYLYKQLEYNVRYYSNYDELINKTLIAWSEFLMTLEPLQA